VQGEKIHMSNLKLVPDVRNKIRSAQEKDSNFQTFKGKILEKERSDFQEGENETLYYCNRISVSNDETLRKQILAEVHKSRYTIHLHEVKMYQDSRRVYY
jgi:hypothetical protein